MNAVEIFQFFQNKGYLKLNPEKIRKSLLRKKQTNGDIELSLKLMACIAVLNEVIFPPGNDIAFHFIPGVSKYGFTAQYCPGPGESYDVFVEDISKDVNHEIQNVKLILISEDGELDHSFPRTLEQYSIGTAVHENRHRIQRQKGFRMFKPGDVETSEGRLKHFLRFVTILQETTKEYYEEAGKSKYFISKRMSPVEFDARIIEYLAMDMLYRETSLESLIGLVLLQAPLTIKD
ncbi:MAG: hypothetical protein WC287_00220 [Candidatus Paceibacterota bacterium]